MENIYNKAAVAFATKNSLMKKGESGWLGVAVANCDEKGDIELLRI